MTEAAVNATETAADPPCEAHDVVCSFGLSHVLGVIVMATLCGCVFCCVLPGALWSWRRRRRHGRRFIAGLGQWCTYTLEGRRETKKTHVIWQPDPEECARRFHAQALDLPNIEDATSFECRADVGRHDATENSSLFVDASHRLELRSGRRLSRDCNDVSPVPHLFPAYPHKWKVEYFSCTHHQWVRGVVMIDVLECHVQGTKRWEELVYGVRLARTQQFRQHVPLQHLRMPQEVGHLIEVSARPGGSWNSARIRKITFGKTERYFVVDLDGDEVTVAQSSTRPCFPVGTQVWAYRGQTLGWQRGVVGEEVTGVSWNSSASGEHSGYMVSRALQPHPGQTPTDFGFVPDHRVFAVELEGQTESVPAHLLAMEVPDELLHAGCSAEADACDELPHLVVP